MGGSGIHVETIKNINCGNIFINHRTDTDLGSCKSGVSSMLPSEAACLIKISENVFLLISHKL